MDTSCNDYRSLVPAYLDGELSEAQAGPLRRHLLACAPCRVATQGQRSLRAWFVPTAEVAVPEGFAARVARRAFAGDTGEPPPAGGTHQTPGDGGADSLRSFVIGMTALAAGLLLALSLGIRALDVPTAGEISADADVPMRLERILSELDALEDPSATPEGEEREEPPPAARPADADSTPRGTQRR